MLRRSSSSSSPASSSIVEDTRLDRVVIEHDVHRGPGPERGAVLARLRALLDAGTPWDAIDLARDACERWPADAELSYWNALASARAGAVAQARGMLDRIESMPGVSQSIRRESLCLGGRLWKGRITTADPGAATNTGSKRDEAIRRARVEYVRAYAVDRDPYPGVNAATLSMLAGERTVARALATEVLTVMRAKGRPLTAWEHASFGEALLLVGHVDKARACYAEAVALAPHDAGSIASMRRQLRLIAQALPDANDVLDVLPAANVLAFAGHMVDRPDARTARFPAALEPAVRAAIDERLSRLAAPHRSSARPIVCTSAACGGDLIFIEAALAVDAEVHVVLPFARDEFVRTSVAVGGVEWIERFDRALAASTRVILATDEAWLGDEVLFEHAQRLIEGIASLRAAQLETDARLLVVLDPSSPVETGGTRASHDRWRRQHGEPDVIDLGVLRASMTSPPRSAPASDRIEADAVPNDTPRRSIKTLLFADIAGYGRLHDALAPLFHARFLSLVADEIAACATRPLESNTWGDAIYVVFDDPADGAAFALGILDRMRTVDWVAAGLEDTSRLRIAIHAGPVFCGFDPIAGRDNYFGASVTQAARIEPVVQPGLAYASEAFAATLTSQDATRYAFEYVGTLELAKRYGASRLYRLERR